MRLDAERDPGGTYTVQGYIDFRSEVLMYRYGSVRSRCGPSARSPNGRNKSKRHDSGQVSSDNQPNAKRLALAA
jgi:hypothetical protein